MEKDIETKLTSEINCEKCSKRFRDMAACFSGFRKP